MNIQPIRTSGCSRTPALRIRPLLLACVLGLAAGPATAQVIIYSGIRNVSVPADFDGVYIDLDTGTTSTSELANWDINLFFGGYAIANSATFQPVRQGTTSDSLVLNLAPGTLIDASGPYASADAGSEGHIGTGAGQFQAGTEGYLGFKFEPTGGGGPYYGWMRMILTMGTAGAQVLDWAYDNTGAPIVVGITSVPEPGPTAAVALGIAGAFSVIRRHRGRRTPSA